jgi:membrane fusion protein, heavy metal efflux system
MNKSAYIYGIMALAAALVISLYFNFRPHDHAVADEHTHSEMAEDTDHDHEHAENPMIKEVHLNEAQYAATGVALGGFEKKNLSEVINANGYTKLPPQNQAQVSMPLTGTIKSIKVIEGQYVKAGQVLATMQSLAYNNLRLEREKLVEQLQIAQANLEYLKQEFARQKELNDENVNARKVFQKVNADLQIEEGKVKALQAQIAILSQNIQVGGNANSPLINITAPISGHVTEVNVHIGSAVVEGNELFALVDNAQMHVDLLVYEKDLFKVKPGQTVRFVLTNQDNQEIRGKIFSVGKAFANDTKSVAVHADIVNERQLLIPGMYVNALIDVGSNQVDALPQDAIVKADGREFIFLQEGKEGEEYHFQRIEVKTGVSQLGYTQVQLLQKVEPGQQIVQKGAYYLQAHLTKTDGGGGHAH